MANKFRFKAVGDADKIARLPEAVQDVLTNFEELYGEAVFPWMAEHVKKVYATQGAAAGEKWQDYSREPAYAWYKASLLDFGTPDDLPIGKNQPGGLMRWAPEEDEWLYPSLKDRDDPRHIESADGSHGEYGTSVPHAERLAQTGGSGPFGEAYPPRPILSMSSDNEKRLRIQIATYYCQELSKLDFDIDCDEQTIMSLAGVG